MKSKLLLLMLLIGSMCFAQAPTDYYAYYPFTNGSIVNQANPGTGDIASGSYTFTTDRFGASNNAMDCENVRANGFSNLNAMNEFAVSFWVKMDVLPNSSTTGTQRVIDFYENAANGDYVFFNRTAPDDFEIVYQINGQVTSHTFSSNALQTGQWCHVVLQSDRLLNGSGVIDNQLQFFFNGNFETVISSNLNLLNSGSAFSNGGVLSISRASNFPGLVDDIQLFDRTLTSQEVSNIYNPCTSIVNIPDANFKAALLDHGVGITGAGISVIDTDGDDEICDVEAQAYTGTIDVPFKNISDLTGIEAFTSASILYVNNNQLTSLDVSNNLSLETIYFSYNTITQADLSLNTLLTRIYANNNQLTSLNVGNGNNSNISAMRAQGNLNLTCIQHDAGFDPTTNSNWLKDSTASWSTNCSPSSCTSIVNIPDANFKNALLAHGTTITGGGVSVIDTDGDGEICASEATAYAGTIKASSLSISDLTGIEAFTSLTQLWCYNNSLNSLDVSQNTALTELKCYNSSLSSLDISQNTALTYLDCSSNSLNSLDVSQNTTLTELYCSSNSLSSLDVSQNIALTTLFCFNNSITSLNLANGNNSNMTHMWAQNNPNLTCIQHDTGFDPTTNNNWTKDTSASWSDNCPTCTVTIPDPVFKSVLVGNTAINTNGNSEIECTEAAAYTGAINANSVFIDPFGNPNAISDFTGLEAFVNLTEFDGGYNSFPPLDLSANTVLEVLELEGMGLTSLDLSNQAALRELDLDFNNITNMDLSSNLNLVNVSISSNGLTSLNVTGCSNLENLFCGNNQLASLDVSSNTALERLRCHLNPLTSIDVSSNLSLISLQINNCQLTSLDVSANINLDELYCQTNQLTSLNVANGNNSNMTFMNAYLNSNLSCIQHDTGFDPTTVSVWQKDATASWSDNCSLSVEDYSFDSTLILYPNPATDIINISTSYGAISKIEVFSMIGKKVLETEDLRIDISKMEDGIYLFKIENEVGQTAIKKIVKQ